MLVINQLLHYIHLIILADLSLIDETRRRMPLDKIRRNDLFETVDLTKKNTLEEN